MKYYLHDSNAFNDEKITELFINFGFEGLGLFYTILEKLAQQEKPVKTSVLKTQLKVGKRLNKCWNFMESLDIISSNNGETFNKQLLNYSEKYLIKKEKNRKRIANWREKQDNVTCNKSVRNTYVTPSNITKDKISKDNIITSETSSQVQEIFNLFYNSINKNINFGNKTQRKAVEDMIRLQGFDRVKKVTTLVVQAYGSQYCPVITTPLQLKDKWSAFGVWIKGQQSNQIEDISNL